MNNRISVTRKKSPNVYKNCPKMRDFETFTKECERLIVALKSCPKCKKSPNLVTLNRISFGSSTFY